MPDTGPSTLAQNLPFRLRKETPTPRSAQSPISGGLQGTGPNLTHENWRDALFAGGTHQEGNPAVRVGVRQELPRQRHGGDGIPQPDPHEPEEVEVLQEGPERLARALMGCA